MTEKDDLRARLYELHVGTDEHHATARQIRVMILDGDLAGAADALDALETDIHPALAAGSGGGGSGPVLLRSTTLNTAAVLALDTTTVELVPAPVGRRYIWPLALLGHYRFGSTPFTVTVDGSYFWAGWDTNSLHSLALSATSFADQSEDVYRGFNTGLTMGNGAFAFPASQIEGTPLILFGSGDADQVFPSPEWLTDGDGSLTIRTWYSVIDGAP
jgi:hypothetical protein